MAAPTAAVGQVVRQGWNEIQRILVLPVVIHKLPVVDPKHRSGRASRRALVWPGEPAHGVALQRTYRHSRHTSCNSHYLHTNGICAQLNVALHSTATTSLLNKELVVLQQVMYGALSSKHKHSDESH